MQAAQLQDGVTGPDRPGRAEEAIDALRAQAGAGSAAAMRELGLRLLVGRDAPLAPREATALLSRAAEQGDPEALAQLATLTGAGFVVQQSWNAALDLLQRSAEAEFEWAQTQLLALAADHPLATTAKLGKASEAKPIGAGPHVWRELRASVDIGSWLTPPAKRNACEAPRIRIAEKLAPPSVCAWLIDQSRGRLKPGKMYDGRLANFEATRSCSDFVFDITQAGLVMTLVRARASALMKLPVPVMEPPQIFHYALGEEIKEHYDHVRLAGLDVAERIATLLMYLNDDYDGGELEFPKAGFRHKGRTGDAVFFANVDPAGKPDPLTWHAARAITRGEKWILSQWVQDRPFGAVSDG